jgi:hypothetical protein
MRPLSLLVLVLLPLAMTGMSPGLARAAWPHDTNIGNVPICTEAYSEMYPTIVSDGAGGAIIAWYTYASVGYDVYAQRVNASGAVQWTTIGVPICRATGDQYNPTIASDGAGGAIITWYDFRSGGTTGYDIYAQRVNASGAVQWTTDGVAICTAASTQQSPTIVSDGAGGAIITWHDYRGGAYADIYAQRVNGAGTVQWPANGVAICAATYNQVSPTIVPDGAGGAVITWDDLRGGASWDIYAQRVNASGAVQWPADGVALCTASYDQSSPKIASDGAGGAIVTWQDLRNGASLDIYAQRVSAAGVVQWTANGVALCAAGNSQLDAAIASDGAGGAIVTWDDIRSGAYYDIYAQRVSAAGAVQWTADGVALCTAGNNQLNPAIASDGAGGAVITWQDMRGGTYYDVYAQRVSAAGVVQWTANGVALSTATNDQRYPVIVSDGAGGAIVTWQDLRGVSGLTSSDIYAQRVDQWGCLGVQPTSAGVKDVPNDQGGKVKVSWYASPLDSFPSYSVASYLIYRSVPPNRAAQALSAGATLVAGTEGGENLDGRAIVARTEGALTKFWEYVGTVTASHKSGYSYLAPTVCDSVSGSNPVTFFMIEAITSGNAMWWDSDPDSGYSVDNLSPATPTLLTGNYAASVTYVHWTENSEADLAGYRLYRGSSADFVPGPGNLVAAQPDTGYSDTGSPGSYYKLSAVDTHGNESGFALLTPAATTDVGAGAAPREVAFAAPSPNPARQGTLLSFALPRAGSATLAVYDMSGRRVRTVRAGWLEAGRYQLPFDLRDGDERRLPSGLYLVRFDADGLTLVRRLAILR